MVSRKIKIDLEYLRANNSFIYPLYSKTGEMVLEARAVLTAEKISQIEEKYGRTLYYTDTGERAVIPAYRMKIAYNKSREIMEEIMNTEKLSRTSLRDAEKVVEEIVNDLNTTEIEAVELLKDLKSHDEYLYNHSVNVGILAALFAKKRANFSLDEIKYITLGSYLHDIGSTRIDKQLLNKEGKLNITEVQKMKRHPQLGYEILKNIERVSPIVLQSVLFHHEKFNNRGYYGLPYENLPDFPKIVSICDIYDALTSKRPFREAVSTEYALKAIVNTIDVHFDYDIISDFINKVAPILNHSQSFYTKNDFCELNTQELAMIRDLGQKDYLKPRVTVFCKFVREGNRLAVNFYQKPIQVDLDKDMERKLSKIISNEAQISAIKKKLEERDFF